MRAAAIPYFEKTNAYVMHRDIHLPGGVRLSAPVFIVACIALITNAVQVLGAPFVFYGDSWNYVMGAYEIFRNGNFTTIGNFRTPGYHFILGPIFSLTGNDAIQVMSIVQHFMAVLISLIVVLIGEELDKSRWLGLVAGVVSAFSLQIQALARIPMTEVSYVLFVFLGILLCIRYTKSAKTLTFICAVASISFATLIRPAGMVLPILFLAIPIIYPPLSALRGTNPQQNRVDTAGQSLLKRMGLVAAGATIVLATLLPWSWYNWKNNGYFGLVSSLGVNLYSTTIEYGNFVDPESPSFLEIRKTWDRIEASRAAKGKATDPRFSWRNHLHAFGHLREAFGGDAAKADRLMLQAALDAISKNPWAYARQVFENIRITLLYAEPAYRYVPGLRDDDQVPSYMPNAWTTTRLVPAMESLKRTAEPYAPGEENPVVWRTATVFTPVFGAMSSLYHELMMRPTMMLILTFFGFACAMIVAIRNIDLGWLILVTYVGYAILAPLMVVPGSPRHRLPADPALTLLFAYGLICSVSLALKTTQKLWTSTVRE